MKLAAILTALLAASPALAVKTQHFTHTSAEDFKKGTTHNVLATSTGQLRLAPKIDALLPKDRHFDAIQAMAEAPDGAIVFTAFPGGEVLSLKDGKLTTLATFKDQTVTALAYDAAGRLLIGVGGEKARLVRLDKPNADPVTIAEPADAKYVWAIRPDADATFVATGPAGGVFKIDAQGHGAAEPFAELSGDNVLCLTADKDSVYAGTDTDACVYKIDRKTAKPYVLYEADETEISALAWDDHGNLLAATSEPRERPAAETPPAEPAPAKHAGGVELPAKKPPPLKPPDEKPGDAIPKAAVSPPHLAEPTTAATAAEPNAGAADASAGSGTNAVYRIDPRGLVTEVFRKPVVIYGMAVHHGSLVLATGDDGAVYDVDPDTGEEAVLLRADAPDATGLLTAKDGTLYVATSNAGQVYKMSAGCATDGTYESEALDAAVPSAFGQLHLLGTLPDATTLTVQTRAGNTDDPDAGDWADWTAPVAAKAFVPVASSPARFLQYRLNFTTTDPSKSAVVDEVDVAYQKPNLPPKLTALTVTPAGEPPGQMAVSWEAADANDDALRYTLAVRPTGNGPWMKIADDLTETAHVWSAKDVPDGTYELKVTASDAAANAPGDGREASRTSDGVLVDNTPPVVGDIRQANEKPAGAAVGTMTVTFRVVDRTGTVAGVETSLDRVDHWQKRLPDDNMADSPEERYTVSLPGLAKGPHALMVRATDARGNSSYETVAVTVP